MTATLQQPPVTPVGPPPADPTRTPLGRTLLWAGVALGVATIAWGGVQVADLAMSSTERASATYDAADVVELVADGRVSVFAGDQDLVDVERIARSGFSSPTYSVQQRGDRLVVRHECGSWFGVCTGALQVHVPRDTHVVVRTSNGDVLARGLAGDLEARTYDGRVEADRITGDAQLHSSNGDVIVTDVSGDVTARTYDGRIDAQGVGGRIEAVTSNGDVQVVDVGGDAIARSSDGSIEVADVQGDVEAATSNGDATVFGTGEPVALTISTSNGRQTVEAPTDPSAPRTVLIRSYDGHVSYLAPR
ncbi:hypothetical protein CTKZ_13410 [Cellulomonas algicola]|uniref:Uncharacterized protein n=1 Tax=Cellulomonas algicola TaxID=2071633 RepID=A0A401UYL6_9CELL|nr:DUF4097 family beta strand repeat-containing protein [Cellulomonas algicola]GCD19779.1 hypothetical protein CTKZ_13410 [Cellulomonas algicola]